MFPGASFPTLGLMARQALGRNLGTLLGGNAPATGGGAPVADAPVAGAGTPARTEPSGLSLGVRSLARGHQTAPPPPPVPVWYLFGGDILLTALALTVICLSRHPVSWPREVFCAAAVTLGGCLGVAALFLSDEPSGAGTGVVPHGKTPE